LNNALNGNSKAQPTATSLHSIHTAVVVSLITEIMKTCHGPCTAAQISAVSLHHSNTLWASGTMKTNIQAQLEQKGSTTIITPHIALVAACLLGQWGWH
jgi:hypothetical protein